MCNLSLCRAGPVLDVCVASAAHRQRGAQRARAGPLRVPRSCAYAQCLPPSECGLRTPDLLHATHLPNLGRSAARGSRGASGAASVSKEGGAGGALRRGRARPCRDAPWHRGPYGTGWLPPPAGAATAQSAAAPAAAPAARGATAAAAAAGAGAAGADVASGQHARPRARVLRHVENRTPPGGPDGGGAAGGDGELCRRRRLPGDALLRLCRAVHAAQVAPGAPLPASTREVGTSALQSTSPRRMCSLFGHPAMGPHGRMAWDAASGARQRFNDRAHGRPPASVGIM